MEMFLGGVDGSPPSFYLLGGIWLTKPVTAHFPPYRWLVWLETVLMRVVVLSAATGELVWDHTNTSFWQIRGWELRGRLCEAIRCTQYFSVILLVKQLLLCDMAYIGEYADGEVLTAYMLRRGTRIQRISICNRPQRRYATVIDLGYGQSCRKGST